MDTKLIILTFAPTVLILSYVIFADKFREPFSAIATVFFLGVVITLFAGYFNSILIPDNTNRSYLAGVTEESLKYLVLYFYVRKKSFFDEPMDAIVYAVLISLGFATIENYEYVTRYILQGENVAVLRAFSAVPLHAMCGIVMGYYFGVANFHSVEHNYAKALLFPMGIHAAYNFVTGYTFYLTTIFITILFFYSKRLHQNFSELQKNKKTEYEPKILQK
jgi:protease PrsW